MEKVSKYVEDAGFVGVSSRNEIVKALGGNVPNMRRAIDCLLAEGYLAEDRPGDQESQRYDRLTDLQDHGDPSLSRFLDRLEIDVFHPNVALKVGFLIRCLRLST